MTTQAVNITKTYNAPIDKVFDAWTQADLLKKWHAPGEMITPEVFVDLSVGGEYFITMQMPDGTEEHTAMGKFLEIEKPTRLVFTWLWKGTEPQWEQESVVTVSLTELAPNKTQLDLTHDLLPDEEQAKGHGEGWNAIFSKLDDFLAQSK